MNNANTETIYREISKLSTNKKMILLSKLISEISTYIKSTRKVNIYDIKGVGKEIWEGMNA